MFTRTKTRTIRFDHPFALFGLEGLQPAGDYQVLEDEEQITGISWLAYRRISTMIEIRAGQTTSRIAVDGEELDAAMVRDQADAIASH